MPDAEHPDVPSERALLQAQIIDRVYQLLSATIKYGALVWIAYFASESVGYLAGSQTEARFEATVSVAVQYLRSGTGELVLLCLVLAATGIAYGVVQKRLRRRAVSHLTSRVRELEMRLDPNRTSSELTLDGRTNPDDL